MKGTIETRHARAKRLARLAYTLPGCRPAVRNLVRVALQHSPLPHAGKQRLFNFFAHDVGPRTTVGCRVAVPGARSLRVELPPEDDLGRNWYFWGYSGFEPGLTRLVMQLLETRRHVFDVGAHLGYYSLLAASLIGARGSVHAFEPSPDVFASLRRNVELNNFGRVQVEHIALADVDGEGELYVPERDNGTNASLVPDFAPRGRSVRVPLMRFDTYCALRRIERVDLLKIDVEGAELRVLRGMGDLLHTWQPDIILEVLRPFAEQLDEFFRGLPYRKYLVTNDGLRELSRIEADPWFRDVYLSCA